MPTKPSSPPLFDALEARTGKAPAAPQQPPESADNLHRQDEEAALWRSISEQHEPSAEEYRFYLKTYPNGTFADLARLRLAKLKPGPLKWLNKKIIGLGAVAGAILMIIGLGTDLVSRLGFGVDEPLPETSAATATPTPEVPAITTELEAAAGPVIADRELQPGDTFNDCDDAGWCPEMVVVPAGSFMMGSPDGEEGRHSDGREGPRHRVTIAEPFAIGVYEVTRGQFAAFVEATGYDAGNSCYIWDGGWKLVDGRNWRLPGFAQSDDHPVVCVSWDDARAYVDWLNAELGFEDLYRLPSEAEWEYAARAGTESRRFWGDDLEDREGCAFANAADLTLKAELPDWPWSTMNCRDGHVYTAEVGSFTANDFGLHDPLGNAWEWVQDCWNDSYAAAGRPDDGTVWTTGDCSQRVLRGGSWVDEPWDLRAADRGRLEPVGRLSNFGFRVARTLR